jgi:hypothetical protein
MCFGRVRKISKMAISFVISVRLSALKNRFPRDGYSWNFNFCIFSNISRQFKFHYSYSRTRITATLYEDRYTCFCSRNEKCFRQNLYRKIKTHFVFNILFFWNRVVYDVCGKKYCRADQATDGCMGHGRCVWIIQPTNTHSEYIILNAFLLQQWLYELAWKLRDTYIAGLFYSMTCVTGT